MKRNDAKQYRLNPERKILSGIAIDMSGKVSYTDLQYIRNKAIRRSGNIQTLRFHDGSSEAVVIFEYYGNAKGFKLVRYHLRKFLAAAGYFNLGDVLVSVIIKGNGLAGFPVHGAGKDLYTVSDSLSLRDEHVR